MEELEPGCYGVYEGGKLQTSRYWQLRDRVPETAAVMTGGPVQGGELDEEKVIRRMTGTMQGRLESLPAVARRAAIRQGRQRR